MINNPYYAILIAPDDQIRANVLNGTKKITIRTGKRDYKPGKCYLCCPEDPFCVQVNITEVTFCRLGALSQEDLEADGFTDFEDCLKGLRRFYPNVDENSEVTVIKWDGLRGKMVDDYNS